VNVNSVAGASVRATLPIRDDRLTMNDRGGSASGSGVPLTVISRTPFVLTTTIRVVPLTLEDDCDQPPDPVSVRGGAATGGVVYRFWI
jgi:hypothetical protein